MNAATASSARTKSAQFKESKEHAHTATIVFLLLARMMPTASMMDYTTANALEAKSRTAKRVLAFLKLSSDVAKQNNILV